jgi:4-amino-4-deoxy-L-arabinose transferase-like glycosyltransferase
VRPRLTLSALFVVFFASLLPFAGTFFQHYPDERNYSNAAIIMINTGDALTPRWADGSANLHKPILAYWLVAGSYALFGVNLSATRLPFMLAGMLVVALTYATARRLGASRETAILAAVITLSEPEIILASMRAIPDVLLCLFLLLSAHGFLELIVLDRRTPRAYWAAYLGAALAVETKGMLALVFVAFAWAFARLDPGDSPAPARRRSLFHAPSVLVSLAVTLSWYALMYWLHGERLLRVFFGDQIATNLEVSDGSPLTRIPAYLASLLLNLFPWCLLLVPLALYDRGSFVPAAARERRAQRFILLWGVLMAVIFGFGHKMEPRYILPAGPLFAILLAQQLERADARLTARALGWLLAATLVVLAVYGGALSWLDGALLGARAALLVAALFAAVLGTIALATRGPRGLSPAGGVGLAVLLAFPLTVIAVGPALQADAGVTAMARDLERAAHRNDAPPILVTGTEPLANKLRVITRGRVPIDSWSGLPARDAWPPAMVLPVQQAAALDLTGYRSREIATEIRSVPVPGLLAAMLAGQAAEFLDARRDHYVIALRR